MKEKFTEENKKETISLYGVAGIAIGGFMCVVIIMTLLMTYLDYRRFKKLL